MSAGLPAATHTPSEVKAAVTGYGSADKRQVQSMIARILRLDAPPTPADAADALALAITHLWRAGAQNRLADAHVADPRAATAPVAANRWAAAVAAAKAQQPSSSSRRTRPSRSSQ